MLPGIRLPRFPEPPLRVSPPPTATLVSFDHGELSSIFLTSLSFQSVYGFDCQKSAAHRQAASKTADTASFFMARDTV